MAFRVDFMFFLCNSRAISDHFLGQRCCLLQALVRSITCWTLSRYCHYVVQQDHNMYFKQLLKEVGFYLMDKVHKYLRVMISKNLKALSKISF